MNNHTRSDLALHLLLEEEESSFWHAELTHCIAHPSFQLDDFVFASNLILTDCSPNFAQECGRTSPRDLIGRTVNRFIFGDSIQDVVVHKGLNHLPNIVKFVSIHRHNSNIRSGFINSLGLVISGTSLVGMLGHRREITRELKSREARQEVKESLTTREFQIFIFLAKGRSVKEIASSIGMMEKTVYFHIENIKKKMHTCGIMDIVQKAYRLGFMDSTESR
ncbi:MAG TPA: LuxR C-terminal-related transcriptional regulator [Bacteroidota bacterium]|nr:LuxR C-terminal-related transcriptional regulator [Bacteroidota bacterium]